MKPLADLAQILLSSGPPGLAVLTILLLQVGKMLGRMFSLSMKGVWMAWDESKKWFIRLTGWGCADNQPQKNYFNQPQKINVKIFAGMVDCSVSLRHEKQGNKALLKKLKIMAHGITYAELQTAKKRHELAAQTLRYAGYNARCVKNDGCAQPYQVNVKGIDSNTAKELQVLVCGLLKDETLNVTEA